MGTETNDIAARLAEIKEKIRGAAPRDPALDLWTDTRWLIEQLEGIRKRHFNDCMAAKKSGYEDGITWVMTERDRLAEENERLRTALNRLANEAAGFLQMADRETHGNTNMRVLEERIQEGRDALVSGHTPTAAPKNTSISNL